VKGEGVGVKGEESGVKGEGVGVKGEDSRVKGEGLGVGEDEEALFLKLKELRGRLAREIKAPAYIVFSDASLREMCRKRPRCPEQFLNVAGVGKMKLEKYGDAFMSLIRDF
jgi:ATP-dependent DNA helicase RecQ